MERVTPTPRWCDIGPTRRPPMERAPIPRGLARANSIAGRADDSLPDVGDTRSHDGRRGSTLAAALEEEHRVAALSRALPQTALHARTVDWPALAGQGRRRRAPIDARSHSCRPPVRRRRPAQDNG